MIKLLVALTVSLTSIFGLVNDNEGGVTSNVIKYTESTIDYVKSSPDVGDQLDVAMYLYRAGQEAHKKEVLSELDGKRIPSFWWMMKIAKCETGINWQNGGRYAGAFGIYTGTWKQWGGLEFAPTPDQASPEEQIVVWLRVHVLGYQPIFKSFVPSAGWNINSCWHGAGDVQWITYDLLQ